MNSTISNQTRNQMGTEDMTIGSLVARVSASVKSLPYKLSMTKLELPAFPHLTYTKLVTVLMSQYAPGGRLQ